MIRMGVSGWMFLLVPAYPGCPGSKAVKRSLLLLLSRTTWVSRYQKGKTSLDFTEARDSEWQWHQLGHMQVCTSLQTYNHASTLPLNFLQTGCPSCRPTNSVKALKGLQLLQYWQQKAVLLPPMTKWLLWLMPDIPYTSQCTIPSVLWRCWLGGRKGIRPVKIWGVGFYLSGTGSPG